MRTIYKFTYIDTVKGFRVCLLYMKFLFIFLQSYPLGKFVLKESSVIAQWAEPRFEYTKQHD